MADFNAGSRFNGDVVFVLDQFMGKNQVGIIDLYFHNAEGKPKIFQIKNGEMILHDKNGEVVMGQLLIVASPTAGQELVEALSSRIKDREVVIIPAT